MTNHNADNHECPVCILTNEILDLIEEAEDQHPIQILRALSNATATVLAGINTEGENDTKGTA